LRSFSNCRNSKRPPNRGLSFYGKRLSATPLVEGGVSARVAGPRQAG
jgi:hypothetical protein